MTAWRCIPWRSVPRLSTITCSAGWVRRATSVPLDVAAVDRETGACVNRLSRTGSGDLTGTALKARKVTCQTWAPGPPSLRWRCGNKRGELWLKSSSLPLPILTTAGQDIALTQVTVCLGICSRAVILRNVTHSLQSKIQPAAQTHGSQDSQNKGPKMSPMRAVTDVDLGQVELQSL